MTPSFSQNDPQTVHQTPTPKITIFRCNPGEAIYTHTHACTRTPTHPSSKNRQVRVKIIKKMKMLAQVKVNAECLINCVREKIINEEMLFLSFFFSPEGIIERRKRSIRVRNWAACFGRCLCVRLSCHFCVVLEGESDTHAYTSVSLL